MGLKGIFISEKWSKNRFILKLCINTIFAENIIQLHCILIGLRTKYSALLIAQAVITH